MFNSSARRNDQMVVDVENGTVVTAPATTTVSPRWANTHPFVQWVDGCLYVGPDAQAVLDGRYAPDVYVYQVDREEAGTLYVTRIA